MMANEPTRQPMRWTCQPIQKSKFMQLLDDEPTGFSTHPTMISDDAATFLDSPSVATIFHHKASLFEPEQNHLHFTKHPNALSSS